MSDRRDATPMRTPTRSCKRGADQNCLGRANCSIMYARQIFYDGLAIYDHFVYGLAVGFVFTHRALPLFIRTPPAYD
jgi:hypothetical protein